ncbi:MAG: septal ring lytic transglycosylase RlpA family protein [Patescibacteria group bacterium]|jgi:hypothetical protein
MKKSISLILLMIVLLCGFPGKIYSQDASVDVSEDGISIYSSIIDPILKKRQHVVALPDDGFYLEISNSAFKKSTEIVIKKRKEILYQLPENFVALSDFWEYDIVGKNEYDKKTAILFRLDSAKSDYLKKIIFWNGKSWQELPSKIVDIESGKVEAKAYLPFLRFLVVADMTKISQGQASWYRYKSCLCAASPDYPKGSILRVTNIENSKSVEVKVNDFGPDRSVHPDRVIDLDLVAFGKIAKKGAGLVSVLVEPIKVNTKNKL